MSANEVSLGDDPRPIVIGTGLVALDVVFGPSGGEALGRWAGGTCGNVLTILSCLGWTSFPVARLAADDPSQELRQDLATWRVRLDYVTHDALGSTPMIVEYIRRDAQGSIIHKFSFQCPVCRHRLPGFRPVPSRDVKKILPGMPKPEVFFFDRCSRGAVELAAAFRRTGALVVFEPSSQGDPSIFQDALGLAHIVKYSHERWAGSERIGLRDANWLLVETLGQDGLRFYSRSPSYRSKGWENLPGLQVEQHKDAAGSGDWCTAGLIACLGAGGAEGMRNADEQEIRRALQQGQSLAAWNCGYEGARGGMYSTQREKLGELARTIAPTFSALRLEPRTAVKDGSARIKRVGFKCCHVSNHHMI